MTDEPAFLALLRARPADTTARLVFADWLEEQGDALALVKARYLRTDARLGELTDGDPGRDDLVLRLRELAGRLDPLWTAAVARVPVENCGPQWQFVCPKKWDRLDPTDDPAVRFCGACRQAVHYCGSIAEAQEKARAGECVAVDLSVARQSGDLTPPPASLIMGVFIDSNYQERERAAGRRLRR